MKLIVNHKKFDVQLAKNTTALAFEQLLPISLDMEELNGNEKYAYLGEALPSAPQCPTQIHAGDIMLFGGNCLVIFYKSFTTRYAYTRIGYIQDVNNLCETLGKDGVRITIE